MKVLVLHNHYREYGGESAVFAAETELLRAAGHTVHLWEQDSRAVDTYTLRQKIAFFPKTLYNSQAYRALRTLVERERPDVAHIHNVFPLFSPSVYRALDDAGIPMVQTIHNFRFLCPNGLFYTHGQICERCAHGNTLHAVRYRCYRQSGTLSGLYALSIGAHRAAGTFNRIDRVVALTEFGATKLKQYRLFEPQKISVLGNFLPDPLPQPVFDKSGTAYIAYLGRISPEKGLQTLLQASALYPQIPVKIAGGGEALAALQQSARHLPQVDFVGYLQGDEKITFLQNALLVVMPSTCYEMFGITALEAMACGTPVVASNLGGLASLIDHNHTGLLFSPANASSLTQQIQLLHQNPRYATQLAKAARQYLEKNFTAGEHLKQLVAIYHKTI
ncbi:MAG: glycosyltransferase [Anaerolineales bacterium]